jgi:hypothetical protein
MSIKSTVISQFIQTNAVAYDKAAVIFHAVENTGETWATGLAAAGVVGSDVKVFAVVFVAKESGVLPHDYRGTWVFTKDSAEHSRVKYLCAVISGAAARKAGERKSAKVDPVDAVLKAYKALTAAQKKAFMAAI